MEIESEIASWVVDGLIWLAFACISGTANGFGFGGGVILVPLLQLYFLAHQLHGEDLQKYAVATSTVAMTLSSGVSAFKHSQQWQTESVQWVMGFVLASLSGSMFGAWLLTSIDADWVGLLLVFYLGFRVCSPWLLDAGVMVSSGLIRFDLIQKIGIQVLLVGMVASISPLLGIGGGIIYLPLFTDCWQDSKKALSMSALLVFSGALIATGFYAWESQTGIGWVDWHLALFLGSMGSLFAYKASEFASRLTKQWLDRLVWWLTLAGFLITLMIWSG